MPKVIPTGCDSLDRLLEGGIPTKTVTLIYGEAETGKTTLALQCVINCARIGYKSFFIDCDSSFSSKRLLQIASENYEEVASQIILARPTNFKEQTHLINELEKYITEKFALIIVDTITSLYRVELGEENKKTFALNRELNQQIALLAQIAKTKNVSVIITSQVQNVFLKDEILIEPVATRILKFWSEVIIKLKPTSKSHLIQVVLEKHMRHTRAESCFITKKEAGIYDYKSSRLSANKAV